MNRNWVLSVAFAALPLTAQDTTKPAVPEKEPPTAPAPKTELRQGARESRPNTWFEFTEVDLGTFLNHEHAMWKFKFRNPNDKPTEWRSMESSCTCASVRIKVGDRRYEITGKPDPGKINRLVMNGDQETRERVDMIKVEAGETGEVEIHMEMGGVTGVRQATLTVHTTDPKEPTSKLKVQATGAQQFIVNPPEYNLNTMTWNESRDFTVTVHSPVAKDFNILRVEDAKDFKINWEKSVNNGLTTWTIHGTYGPLSTETGVGGNPRFVTDLNGSSAFNVRVVAIVKGPMDVRPNGCVLMGKIGKGNARTEKIEFEPNDGTDLSATDVRFEKLSVAKELVSWKQHKDGKKLIVELEVSPDAPVGLLRGDMVIQLNHPTVKEKRILFNGYVR